MKAIILAAGRGSRMKNKTDVLPKCLTKLWGKTLLEWQLEALRNAGIDDICIVTGYHAEEIEKRYTTNKYLHNENWQNTNMVSTLICADTLLSADECIISYADIVYKKEAVDKLIASKSEIALTYYTEFKKLWENRFENPLDDVETFKIDENHNIIEIGQKAKSLDEIDGQYMGLLKITPKGWHDIKKIINQSLPKPIEKMDMTGLLEHLIKKDIKLKGIPYDKLWVEVDSPEDLDLYNNLQYE